MALTREQIEHIAHLARLAIKDEEKEKFRDQLSAILDYFEKLAKVNTRDVPIISQITDLKNVAREDEVKGCDTETRELLLKNMPMKENNLLKVKAVFE